ncbi:MAG: hypothetical protein Q7S28_01170 [bacterium]|nr:hypothetical protein [bacterium]
MKPLTVTLEGKERAKLVKLLVREQRDSIHQANRIKSLPFVTALHIKSAEDDVKFLDTLLAKLSKTQ